MDLNVENHLRAVKRTVLSLERDTRSARAVTLARSFATTVEDLWDAVTSPERIARWFLPVSGNLELGGRYQLEGNAGGTITQCERPSFLALTWEFGGDVSWVDARLADDGDGRARLTLTHTSLLSDHWTEFGPGAVGVGWEMGLLGMELHLTRPAEPKIDEQTFHTTPEGKALLTGSSEAWGEAAIAAGTNPEAARAAARRTTAFYTGDPVAEG